MLNIDILGLLVPNVWTTITQLCSTAILFVLMYKLAWKPVKKILDERSAYENEKLSLANRLANENEVLQEQSRKTLAEAHQTAHEIVEEAKVSSTKIANEIVEQGHKDAAMALERAKKASEAQHDQMLEQMHQEMVDVAMDATEKMLRNKIDKEADRAVIDEFIKEVKGL